MGPYQVLPFQVRVDLGVMAMKGYSAFSKLRELMKPWHQIVSCHILDTHWWGRLTPQQRCSRCILQLQRTDRFMPFSKLFVQSEMQTAISRTWIWVTDSISHSNKHYGKHPSRINVYVIVPTLQIIMNFSYYYEYWENIHLGVKLTPA